jgi:hypothetical protein
VPFISAAPIGDQTPAMVFPDTVALSLHRFQAANRHGNGRREDLIAIFLPADLDRTRPISAAHRAARIQQHRGNRTQDRRRQG